MTKSKQHGGQRVIYQTTMHVVDINELPADQKKPFLKWMNGQTQPIFTEFPKSNFAYYSDYELWYGSWSQGGKVAKNWD